MILKNIDLGNLFRLFKLRTIFSFILNRLEHQWVFYKYRFLFLNIFSIYFALLAQAKIVFLCLAKKLYPW